MLSEVYTNKAGVTGGQARVYFRNPLPHTRSSPGRIKVDLTSHEVLVRDPVQREVLHPYTDRPAEGIHALCYDFPEVFAEKTRALAERTRPRDLYDVCRQSLQATRGSSCSGGHSSRSRREMRIQENQRAKTRRSTAVSRGCCRDVGADARSSASAATVVRIFLG